jgi:hypothetical protein
MKLQKEVEHHMQSQPADQQHWGGSISNSTSLVAGWAVHSHPSSRWWCYYAKAFSPAAAELQLTRQRLACSTHALARTWINMRCFEGDVERGGCDSDKGGRRMRGSCRPCEAL